MALSILNAISGGGENSSHGPPFIIEKDISPSSLPIYRTDLNNCGFDNSNDIKVGYFSDSIQEHKAICSGINETVVYDVEGGSKSPKESSSGWSGIGGYFVQSIKNIIGVKNK